MQAHRVRVWFVALYVLLLAFNICDSHQHQHQHQHHHKQNPNKARSKYTTQNFDDKPEGKIFGWKKQPQTNVIFITRPAPTLTTAPIPLASTTTTAITSPVQAPTAPAPVPAATVTTVRRPYAQRYGGGGYRRVPVRRQSVRRGQGYRRQRPWNRRRVFGYGREGEEENASSSDVNADAEADTDSSGQQLLGEDERDVKAEMGVRVKEGVSAKLDIEQLEKSLLSHQDTYKDNDAGQIAVVADDLNKVYKQHLKVKSKRPQTTAILATTMPSTFLPAATATDDATSNEPTYANVVVHSNGNTKKKKNSDGDKRQTIWQGIRQAWRDRRERQKNAALKKQEEQQPQVEVEDELEYVDRENDIFIDENGEIHIRKRRKNNNRHRQQNTRQQQLNMKSKQKKRRRQQEEVTNNIKNSNENSVISENNTNSRFQNIMNAFRRTPIIYKQHSR